MVNLNLLNHSFDLECPQDEEASLIAASELLKGKLNEMPATMPNERKAILVALNLCYDYLLLKDESLKNSESIEKKLHQLLTLLQQSDLENLNITTKN